MLILHRNPRNFSSIKADERHAESIELLKGLSPFCTEDAKKLPKNFYTFYTFYSPCTIYL